MANFRPKKLPRSFFDRPTLEVSSDLIGKYIVYESPDGRLSARIVEVEAYIGKDDPACHAARGKTARNGVMFGQPGHSYIYFIYGMYHCLNFVTEREGFPAAVLLRGAEPEEGLEIMRDNSPRHNRIGLLNGPGKLCRSFGLTRQQNGLDLTGDILYLENCNEAGTVIARSQRVGINVGRELLYRFFDKNSDAVSGSAR
jgi:DNA-3-methyladenine glycosylase